MNTLANWLQHHMMTCYYKQLSGIDCPGCGMQRSFIQLLQGHLQESFISYPALLPVLFTLSLTGVHLIFELKYGATAIKYSFILTVGIVTISYILKLNS